jgi:hypothetical protein
MEIDVNEYRKDFLEGVKANAEGNGDGTTASFVHEAATCLSDFNVIPDYTPVFYNDIGKRNKRLRADGYAIDDFDWAVNLLIADYSGSEEPETITATQANQIFDRLRSFTEEALFGQLNQRVDISTAEYDLIERLRTCRQLIRKFKFYLITDKLASERIDNFSGSTLEGIPIEYHLWDLSRFCRVAAAESGLDELEIDFTKHSPVGLPCIEASETTTINIKSYLCVLPGEALANIYDEYGSRLLEANVRSFLSTKVSVNKNIRETILRFPELFFAYNNGIAATATKIITESNGSSKYIKSAKGFQIVNGGQTTASLSNARFKDKADISRIFVQVKISEIDSGASETIIPSISRSSNSQNKVTEADFFSNHPFHVQFEKISRKLYASAIGGAQHETHWFYERARGQYLQAQARMTKAEKAKFAVQNPRNQMVTKTDLAKYHNSWNGIPHKVSMGSQKNFLEFANRITTDWERNQAIFNDSYFKQSIALAIMFKQAEKIVSSQEWYEKGYRANIVTYSIAYLSSMLKTKYPEKCFDFGKIWKQQDLDPSLQKQLSIISKAVFDTLTANDRGIQNVTEWSKREGCWERIKTLKVEWVPKTHDWLIDKEEAESIKKQSIRYEEEEQKINHQIEVVKLGPQYWQNILQWGQSKNLLYSPEEQVVLLRASRMTSNKLPNDFESKKLLEIQQRLLSEGFKIE